VAVGIILFAPASGWAQVNGLGSADPFFLYYGFYLPNQAYQAAQPRPEDTINANAATRQFNALRDRGEFADQSPFAGTDEGLDFGPYSSRGGARGGRMHPRPHDGNVRGTGPAGYYNRTDRYFPGMAVGRGPNKNIAVMRGVRRGGGGMGMPSMPGPR
jgi:hypothetical protein